MLDNDVSLDIATLATAYRQGNLKPIDVVECVLARIAGHESDAVWIERCAPEQLRQRAADLAQAEPGSLPLYGIPFAIKDNIDLAGIPTTAACPAFAYTPTQSAKVVQALIDAGAIAVGKTNLDQFATGLVGTRSPYGACPNSFNPRYISGGSSSGSAVAVAAGMVSFALGTDTAGSGRVPAAFNNLFGLKPTRGRLSTQGVVPACRSLDCVSILALTAEDAARVLAVAGQYDAHDPYARRTSPSHLWSEPPRIGVPIASQLEFFGDREAQRIYMDALSQVTALYGNPIEIDLEPFLIVARLLYEGPWVAERFLAARELLEKTPNALHPVTRKIIEAGREPSAADAFAAFYRLKELARKTDSVWEAIDVLMTPTSGTIYTIDEVAADPIRLNSRLGHYTNYMNLLDLCGLAVPAGFRSDGLPMGVTFVAQAGEETDLLHLGERFQRSNNFKLGATIHSMPELTEYPLNTIPGTLRIAVCGAHLSGLPLNHQLTERGARCERRCHTAPRYRFFALEEFIPPRPGLVRIADGEAPLTHGIEVEVWNLPSAAVGEFLAGIPSPLSIGTVELEDGTHCHGFLCEAFAVAQAREITSLRGWRAYVKQRGNHAQQR